MEDLLARYLDGHLTEDEAGRLMRAVDDDPALASALRDYEALIQAAESLPRQRPGDGFAERVLQRVERSGRSVAPARGRRWTRPGLAVAASLAAGLLIGYWAAPDGRSPDRGTPARDAAAAAVAFEPLRTDDPGVRFLRAVQLTYVPDRDDVSRVSVAGSFNGWDPETAPMRRENGTWTILLVLPPGTHEYMLVEDGERWITDPTAPGTRRDGFGGANGLLDVRS
jgi:hypothetical protein